MALTKKQLEWARRAYSPSGMLFCHFPVYSEARGWQSCGSKKRVQIHHIKPQGFIRRILGGNADIPSNLIALCAYNHIGRGYMGSLDHHTDLVPVIHTDMSYAYRKYKDDPKIFDKVFSGREKQSGIYWNSDWDKALQAIADLVIARYLADHRDDPWPEKKRKK